MEKGIQLAQEDDGEFTIVWKRMDYIGQDLQPQTYDVLDDDDVFSLRSSRSCLHVLPRPLPLSTFPSVTYFRSRSQ
jgi:hypothetical protein